MKKHYRVPGTNLTACGKAVCARTRLSSMRGCDCAKCIRAIGRRERNILKWK